MESVVIEWVSLITRWTHITAGIAWIGSSFYFMHLDAALRSLPEIPTGKGGEAWEVHGGGFYQVRKYLVAPAKLPEHLIWHKWQAYSTWLSGMFLLGWIYYLGADLYLVDPAVQALAPLQAAGIGIGSLIVGWLVYDGLVRSPLAKREMALAAVGFAFIVAMAWFYQQVFSGRGAMIHTGALMGTMMVGNVFLNIMPNQRKVIADLVAGRTPNPAYGKQAKTRSTHNNYLTLPVLFLMLSNHFALVYTSPYAYVIVGLVLVAGALVRVFYNVRHTGRGDPWWTWGVAAACLVAAIAISALTAPAAREQLGLDPLPESAAVDAAAPAPEDIVGIVQGRCAMCHAETPAWPGITVAPKGVRLDTPEHIALWKSRIVLYAGETNAMPPNNISEITPEERRALVQWASLK
ncbi:urate hydroxylase PuuD [Ancylobacter oerskovii]|uniref:Urate hydroxylase PuuD n=1 Tax=Ancylobacter oerskovii TaxID=459519 RepID=A0ABW4YWB6_9HYPH|nr:urate hydroxylase PuuD [Ancylobacter oerskovii]MBS7544082.1 urate hydroxylase PuuD [Ancylobacter oerskovii]